MSKYSMDELMRSYCFRVLTEIKNTTLYWQTKPQLTTYNQHNQKFIQKTMQLSPLCTVTVNWFNFLTYMKTTICITDWMISVTFKLNILLVDFRIHSIKQPVDAIYIQRATLEHNNALKRPISGMILNILKPDTHSLSAIQIIRRPNILWCCKPNKILSISGCSLL